MVKRLTDHPRLLAYGSMAGRPNPSSNEEGSVRSENPRHLETAEMARALDGQSGLNGARLFQLNQLELILGCAERDSVQEPDTVTIAELAMQCDVDYDTLLVVMTTGLA